MHTKLLAPLNCKIADFLAKAPDPPAFLLVKNGVHLLKVVWCGVVWCGVVWCGVVWCGVVWCGVVWFGVVWCGVMWWCGSVGDVDCGRRRMGERGG